MRARLPQTNKEEYKNVSKERQKNKCGKEETNSSRWEIEREREREKEKVTETAVTERGEKKQEKVSVLFWKNGIHRTKTAAVTRQPD
jgi:hypothetical protein